MGYSKLGYYFKSFTYLLGRFVLRLNYMTAHSKKYKMRFKFRTEDGGGRLIYKRGVYEEELTNYFLKKINLSEGHVVFDIGANIGWYSNLFSKYFNDIEVHSFEPDPENYKLLLTNIENNNALNVIPNNIGIGEKTAVKKLYLYKKSNVGRHSMLNINEGPTIDVPITTIDDYLLEKNIDVKKVKFLKIDIEGFEYFAFLGGKKLLAQIPTIMAEFSPGYMRKGGLDPKRLLSLLTDYNFKPFVISGLDLKPIKESELLKRNRNINLLWKKL